MVLIVLISGFFTVIKDFSTILSSLISSVLYNMNGIRIGHQQCT
jgi:hypothetical protein